ncbi:MAG: TonB-dependent receptor plug domain-containing protein, partial [Saprospiraceae bacterium]|nr:TonB-dependent receptor plug domain-containing protein [Saprospiraceae bacterium]
MRILNIVFLLLSTSFLFGQDRTVTGTVTGAEDGLEMIGATVMIKGSSTGTITDFLGNYELSVPSGMDTLTFSYTGYTTVDVAIGDRSVVDVVIAQESQFLDEIVVIGYGIQKKRVSTGSISKLSAEKLEGYQVQSVQTALEGQVSGLIVNSSSGQPGAGNSLLIRGVSTNGDNSPLYVVDGLQVSGIDNINPEDIESVDVLKDAASSAIYGARAANGVVIITTKKGGDKGKITYEGFTSRSRPWKLPEMLSAEDYILITREKFANGNQTGALNSLGFPQLGDQTPNTNWMDQIFDDASLQSHRLTASAENLYLSLEYWDETGVVGGDQSRYKRYAARINGT